MRPISTIRLLREWARFGQAHNIGYPTMSPMFGERALKSPLFGAGYIPPDIEAVELCVCLLEWRLRRPLILRYQRHFTHREIGILINRSHTNVRSLLSEAEDGVNQMLHGPIEQREAAHG